MCSTALGSNESRLQISLFRTLEKQIPLDQNPGQSKFDLIVCNPPFFSTQLIQDKHAKQDADPIGIANSHLGIHSSCSSNLPRSLARQTSMLSKAQLFSNASRLLAEHGLLSLIYPFEQLEETIDTARHAGLYRVRETHVRSLPGQPFIRVLLTFGHRPIGKLEPTELTIESVHHQYTPEFENLTSNFYLRFA